MAIANTPSLNASNRFVRSNGRDPLGAPGESDMGESSPSRLTSRQLPARIFRSGCPRLPRTPAPDAAGLPAVGEVRRWPVDNTVLGHRRTAMD